MKEIINEAKELLKEIIENRIKGYLSEPFMHDQDIRIIELIKRQMNMMKIDIRNMVDSIDVKYRFMFLCFAERMAIYSVRKMSKEYLIYAVWAMFIQIELGDIRDSLTVMSLLYDASIKLNIPFEEFKNPKFSSFFNEQLDKFINRNEENKKIKAMGYEEVGSGDSFFYRRTW